MLLYYAPHCVLPKLFAEKRWLRSASRNFRKFQLLEFVETRVARTLEVSFSQKFRDEWREMGESGHLSKSGFSAIRTGLVSTGV